MAAGRLGTVYDYQTTEPTVYEKGVYGDKPPQMAIDLPPVEQYIFEHSGDPGVPVEVPKYDTIAEYTGWSYTQANDMRHFDWTPCAFCKSTQEPAATYITNDQKALGVLITPRHMAVVRHAGPFEVLYDTVEYAWMDASGTLYTRNAVSAIGDYIEGGDAGEGEPEIRIIRLSSDLPAEIVPMKVATNLDRLEGYDKIFWKRSTSEIRWCYAGSYTALSGELGGKMNYTKVGDQTLDSSGNPILTVINGALAFIGGLSTAVWSAALAERVSMIQADIDTVEGGGNYTIETIAVPDRSSDPVMGDKQISFETFGM